MIDIDTRAVNFMLSNVEELINVHLLNRGSKGFIEVTTDGSFKMQQIRFIDAKIIPSTYAEFSPFRRKNKEEQLVLFIQVEWKEFSERTRIEFIIPAKYAVKNVYRNSLESETIPVKRLPDDKETIGISYSPPNENTRTRDWLKFQK